MKYHKIAELFPSMPPKDFRALMKDIQANGLIDPIVTYEGKVLDGRNRQIACEQLGVKPRYEKFTGEDPVAFVVSKNLTRRHLDTSQRSAAAQKIAAYKRKGRPKAEYGNAQHCAFLKSRRRA